MLEMNKQNRTLWFLKKGTRRVFLVFRGGLSPRRGPRALGPSLFQHVNVGALGSCPLWKPTGLSRSHQGAAGPLGASPYPELRPTAAMRWLPLSEVLKPLCVRASPSWGAERVVRVSLPRADWAESLLEPR